MSARVGGDRGQIVGGIGERGACPVTISARPSAVIVSPLRLWLTLPVTSRNRLPVPQCDVIADQQIAAAGQLDIVVAGGDPSDRHPQRGDCTDGQSIGIDVVDRVAGVGGDRGQVVGRIGQRGAPGDHQRQAGRDDRVARVLADITGHIQKQVAGPQCDVIVDQQIAAAGQLDTVVAGGDPS